MDDFDGSDGQRRLRLCDRCVDATGHVLCVAEWARSAPEVSSFCCPLCRGPLTAHSSFLMHRHRARIEAPARRRPHVYRGWPSILFAVQVLLGFVSLSVSMEAGGAYAATKQELHEFQQLRRAFGLKIFAANLAVIMFVAWRWGGEQEQRWQRQPQQANAPRPHWANRLSDTIAVAVCCVVWILYEAEQLFVRGCEGGCGETSSWGGNTVAAAATTRQTLQASYLLLSYLLLYAFMLGAEVGRFAYWRMQYLWSCFLYACIISSACVVGGGSASQSPSIVHVYSAFTVTAGFWLLCSFTLCRMSVV